MQMSEVTGCCALLTLFYFCLTEVYDGTPSIVGVVDICSRIYVRIS